MRRNRKLMAVVALVCAGSVAQAGVVTTTTSFTGTTTNLTTVGNQSLPYTDANGRTISSNNSNNNIMSGMGLFGDFGPYTFTFASLASDTTGFGFNWVSASLFSPGVLTSATFSNGDVWTGYISSPADPDFLGFLTDTPFTSVTLSISNTGGSFVMTDFTTRAASPPGVPEPATLVSTALGALGLSVLALRRRRAAVA